MEYHTKRHAVYLCTYHVVFVTKYRKAVISDEIGDHLKNYLEYLVQEAGGEMISVETDRDHVHMLMSLPPDIQPTWVIRILKTQTSRDIKEYFPDEIARFYHGKTSFWSPSYFIATTGAITLEKVKAYVNSQRTEHHHEKYAKNSRLYPQASKA